MKHIESYKIFESHKWIREEINDLLAHIIDDGYVVRISYMGGDSGTVRISPKGNQITMRLDDIKDDIIRMCEILDDRYLCDISYKIGAMSSNWRAVTLYDLRKKKEEGVVLSNPIKSSVAGVMINIYANEN